jgi:hypothetical protein
MDFEKKDRQLTRAIREISSARDALDAELHLGLDSLEVQWAVAEVDLLPKLIPVSRRGLCLFLPPNFGRQIVQ